MRRLSRYLIHSTSISVYLYERLNVLEDVVNVVDGEAESLGHLELDRVVVPLPRHPRHHLVRVEDRDLADVLQLCSQ